MLYLLLFPSSRHPGVQKFIRLVIHAIRTERIVTVDLLLFLVRLDFLSHSIRENIPNLCHTVA